MTATTVPTPEIVREAHAVLDIAMAARWPAHNPGLRAVAEAVRGLDEALCNCQEHAGGAGEARAAGAAARVATALIKVMDDNCGLEWGVAR